MQPGILSMGAIAVLQTFGAFSRDFQRIWAFLEFLGSVGFMPGWGSWPLTTFARFPTTSRLCAL